MAHIVDFLQSQPPDVYRFVLNAIEPLWLEPKADATVREAIKQQFPGRFSDDEIGLLIHGAMFIMKWLDERDRAALFKLGHSTSFCDRLRNRG